MTEETSNQGKPGGSGPLALALPAVLAGAVALGVSYLDPLGGDGANAAEAPVEGSAAEAKPKGEAKAEKKDKKDKKGKKGKKDKGGSGILVLDPMIVSLTQGAPGRVGPRLRIAIALRAPGGADEAETLLLRDGFTTAVHAMEPEVLAGPEGLSTLRAALLDAARSVLGEEAVEGVLITDYVLI